MCIRDSINIYMMPLLMLYMYMYMYMYIYVLNDAMLTSALNLLIGARWWCADLASSLELLHGVCILLPPLFLVDFQTRTTQLWLSVIRVIVCVCVCVSVCVYCDGVLWPCWIHEKAVQLVHQVHRGLFGRQLNWKWISCTQMLQEWLECLGFALLSRLLLLANMIHLLC